MFGFLCGLLLSRSTHAAANDMISFLWLSDVPLYAHVCAHTFICTRMCTHLYMHTYVYTPLCAHVCAHTFICTRMCTHLYMHTYVYTLIYWKEAYQTAKSELELQMTIFFLLFFQKLD